MKEKKSIAILANSMGLGGTQRVISRLLTPLSLHYDVHLLMINEEIEAFDIKVKKHYFLSQEKSNRVLYIIDLISLIGKVNKYIEKNKIECVISFLSVPNLFNSLFVRQSKRIINIRCQLRNVCDTSISAYIKYSMSKLFLRFADGAIVPTISLKNDLQNICKMNERKIKIIYNPFDVDSIREKSREQISEEYTYLYEKYKVIVTLGRLEKEKGYTNLIKSFSKMNQNDDVRLVFIGDGSQRIELENMAKEYDVEDKVIFVGSQSNPYPFLKKSTLFVLSSYTEGFPNALVEAMICGVPVISTDCKSGPREILVKSGEQTGFVNGVELGSYGLLVPSFDMNDSDEIRGQKEKILSRAMEMLLEDSNVKNRFSELLEDRIAFFSIEKIVKQYVELIDEVIGDA